VLEILLLLFLGRKIGNMAESKGYLRSHAQILLVLLWLCGEVGGAVAGCQLPHGWGNPWVIYGCGLAGAGVAAVVAFLIVALGVLYSRVLSWTFYFICWGAALTVAGFTLWYSWDWFYAPQRPDGTRGHTTIDFGGQWLMGRMVLEGNGQYLYERNHLRTVLNEGYPVANQTPEASAVGGPDLDAEHMLWMVEGDEDDPEARAVKGSFLTPLAAADPLQSSVLLAAGKDHWTQERLDTATAPRRGGPLYPPTHALLYTSVAVFRPTVGYRVLQWLNVVLCFVCGLLISLLSRGRVWWPLASLLVIIFPGFQGSINLAQNATVTLTILLGGWLLLARGRPAAGGAVWALLAFKPVWAVAFFPVLLLTRRWTAALSMAVCGALFCLATLPVVGWHSWEDWYVLGKSAADNYDKYQWWILLSRDLYNIPSRLLLTMPERGPAFSSRGDLPRNVSLCLWLGVSGVTFLAAAIFRRRGTPLTGPGAAFLLLGAWMSCFHFMYYDSMLVLLPVAALLADPKFSLRRPLDWPPLLLIVPVCVVYNLAADVYGWGLFPYQKDGNLYDPPGSTNPVYVWFYQLNVAVYHFHETLNYRYGVVAHRMPGDTVSFLVLWWWFGFVTVVRWWRGSEATEDKEGLDLVELADDVAEPPEPGANGNGVDGHADTPAPPHRFTASPPRRPEGEEA